jgi:hypothetical protein
LGANTNLSGDTVTLASGSSLAGAGRRLNVLANADFGGDVSNVSLMTVIGTTRLAANISTSGNQTYTGAITLGADASAQTSGSNAVITTSGSINSDGTARALALNASGAGGQVLVEGAVGNTAALGALTLNASAMQVNGGSVTTTGNQTYSGPLTLGSSTQMNATAANAVVTLANTLNADAPGNRNLNITANGSGSIIRLGAAVGNTWHCCCS